MDFLNVDGKNGGAGIRSESLKMITKQQWPKHTFCDCTCLTLQDYHLKPFRPQDTTRVSVCLCVFLYMLHGEDQNKYITNNV